MELGGVLKLKGPIIARQDYHGHDSALCNLSEEAPQNRLRLSSHCLQHLRHCHYIAGHFAAQNLLL